MYRDPEPDLVLVSYSESDFLEGGIPWQICDCLVLAEGQPVSIKRMQELLVRTTRALVCKSGATPAWAESVANEVCYASNESFSGGIQGNMVIRQSSPGFSHLACYKDGVELFDESSYSISQSRPSQADPGEVLAVAVAIGLSLDLDAQKLQLITRSLL